MASVSTFGPGLRRHSLASLAVAILMAFASVACTGVQIQEPALTSTPEISSTATPLPTSTPEASGPDSPPSVPAPAITMIPMTTSEIARVGQPAPDFELELFDGGKVRLSDFEGKVVVLNFWASWCPPCRKEMPDFERTWQAYQDRGVVFIGVAVQDYEPDSRAFVKETGVTYPIGMDWTGRIFNSYRPTAMPTTFLIDREGIVSRRIASYTNEGMLKIFLKGQLDQ